MTRFIALAATLLISTSAFADNMQITDQITDRGGFIAGGYGPGNDSR